VTDARAAELEQLVSERKLLEQRIADVVATCFGTWGGCVDEAAAALGISRATFYRRFGHLNPEVGRWR
jgi:transcriptional regulator of acetoin/glycerol metabolism